MSDGNHEVDRGDGLGSGIIARYTCGCAVVRDFDGREYQQLALTCPGGDEHGRRVEDPTKQNAHLWRLSLPFEDQDDDEDRPAHPTRTTPPKPRRKP